MTLDDALKQAETERFKPILFMADKTVFNKKWDDEKYEPVRQKLWPYMEFHNAGEPKETEHSITFTIGEIETLWYLLTKCATAIQFEACLKDDIEKVIKALGTLGTDEERAAAPWRNNDADATTD